MIGRIYLVTCELTGKWYFGQTIKSIQSRFNEHFRSAQRGSDHKFHRAIRKYGEENFTVKEVLTVSAPTKDALKRKLDFLEQHFIQKFDTFRNGYNSTWGGESKLGYVTSEETKRKIRLAQLGEKGNRFGKKHTTEEIEKLRKMNLGEIIRCLERNFQKSNVENCLRFRKGGLSRKHRNNVKSVGTLVEESLELIVENDFQKNPV